VSSIAAAPELAASSPTTIDAVALEARAGLTATPRTLSPWLFYDEAGSALFEQITTLPEYYLTRTERSIFAAHADEIVALAAQPSGSAAHSLTIAELGAGTATKTGILLQAAIRRQATILYQPVDCSYSALDEARANIESNIPGVTVLPQLANYVTDPGALSLLKDARPPRSRMLALYIGSSIGNFSPAEARDILANLRAQLEPGDTLLLGTDLAPSSNKPVATLLAAYDDRAGVTADFNRNILARLNRDLGSDFDPTLFAHRAVWNPTHSRIEMHLESTRAQRVHIPANSAGPALNLTFTPGETIHTENSYKFTTASIAALLRDSGFAPTKVFTDPLDLFAVTLATAI
jgi:dimethylhistidine N-methyltransferase